jgi:hypothetical protein
MKRLCIPCLTLVLSVFAVSNALAVDFGKNVAFALKNQVNVRSSADAKSTAIRALAAGQTCTVLGKSPDRYTISEDGRTIEKAPAGPGGQTYAWYNVQTDDGKKGWVFGKFLAVNVDSDVVDENFYIGDRSKELYRSLRGKSMKKDIDGDGVDEFIWFAVMFESSEELGLTLAVTKSDGITRIIGESDPEKIPYFGDASLMVSTIAGDCGFKSIKLIPAGGKKLAIVLEVDCEMTGANDIQTLTLGLAGDRLVVTGRKVKEK